MQALKQYLADKGITQLDFARELGVTQPTVSDWVNGDMSPSLERLKLIAVKTGIPIAELVGLKEGIQQ